MPNAIKNVLLVDDELEHLNWLFDFLAAKGLAIKTAQDLPSALGVNPTPDLLIVDMQIPARDALTPEISKRMPLATKYPGLAVTEHFRTMGVGAHAVIAYTVHDDDELDAALSKLNCRYVLKGRPHAIKQVVQSALDPAPR